MHTISKWKYKYKSSLKGKQMEMQMNKQKAGRKADIKPMSEQTEWQVNKHRVASE